MRKNIIFFQPDFPSTRDLIRVYTLERHTDMRYSLQTVTILLLIIIINSEKILGTHLFTLFPVQLFGSDFLPAVLGPSLIFTLEMLHLR